MQISWGGHETIYDLELGWSHLKRMQKYEQVRSHVFPKEETWTEKVPKGSEKGQRELGLVAEHDG